MNKKPNNSNTEDSNHSFNDKPSPPQQRGADTSSDNGQKTTGFQAPVINLPKGGGAIQGIGEKFQANPVTGTGSMTVPIAMSAGRGGFTPQLALSYDSGSGNSPFGLGWDVGLPQISRKTNKGLPQYDGLPKYQDDFESDVFLLSGAEDLIPVLKSDSTRFFETIGDFTVYRYRPRIEGLFARIEKWVNNTEGVTYWRSITKDNITTIYGESPEATIAHPTNDKKIFTWLIEKTYDDKGNVIVYQYKKENGAGLDSKPIFEKNRDVSNAYTQTYLKHILYGNTIPYTNADFNTNNKWLFDLVFDYGEHWQTGDNLPYFDEHYNWRVRPDIFSSFRSGFEIRTYRLCHRILMFHHFPNELGIDNCLVKATHIEFDENTIATQVLSVTHMGYGIDEKGNNVSKSYPPVNFSYTQQKIDDTIYAIHSADLPHVPQGIDGQQYQFNDLYGEGLNGILKQNGTAWYYKRNLGGGVFAPQELIGATPSLSAGANVQITDFGGDGLTDVMVQTDTLNGYFQLNEDNEWSHFKPFARPVNFDLNDPSLRMIDLDGNGIPDILMTDDDCFVWYAADALEGFKAAKRVAKTLDEESGARVVFKESFQTIFLADMKGDGMTDIVRIRNGEICYWANIGYGRFSPKITMAHAPHFDYPDYFDPSRLRLADIDGSGTTDVVYLGREDITYWLNHSGNSWGEVKTIRHFPKTANLHTVSVFDLLGNGTSCIVWSSPLPAEAQTPMKYVQLMGDTTGEGNKPYLLKEVNNNMGAITRLKYEASTKFYLEDRKLGKPWITKLPFPVQVLIRQEVFDAIAGNHFVSRYAYHHGYFDKVEREFRGFGMVEQWDTEDFTTLSVNTLFENKGRNWSEQTDMPPIYTKTWFHNGFYKQGGKISRQYESEYYKGDADAWLLSDTELPINLNTEEKREAARALKGRALRVEAYGLDGTAAAEHPYTVSESKYHIKTIEYKKENRHACFYVCACESLSYQYERNPLDPRIAHQSTLEIDELGNVLKSAVIVYPRRITSIYAEQNRGYVTYSEAKFINKPYETGWYRIGVPFTQSSYEITGLTLNKPYEKGALAVDISNAIIIPFEKQPTTGSIEKRLLAASKSSFYDETLTSELTFGQIAFHALPFHAYEAVYTEGVLDLFEKDGTPLTSTTIIQNEAGFIPMDSLWWRTSGRVIFDAAHFYQPIQQLDSLGHAYILGYDAYNLAMLETSTQVSGKTVKSSAQLDYRILHPHLLTDPNGNRQTLLFDPLGMVVATAIMGKVSENKGDTLVGYQRQADPSPADVLANPHTYLQDATSFFHYHLFHWKQTGQPNYAVTIVRETHAADTNGQPTKTQINFSYSDGFGQAIMIKVQAEPGDALRLDNGQVINDLAAKRWVGNGRTVFNNKGKPVKQYEPYFSHTHGYEMETELVEYGVTPVLNYDPVGRNIRTDLPDGTFTKVEFTAWEQATFDQNDTVLESDWYGEKSVSSNIYEKRAATLAAAHANTPKVEYLDTLGRVFLLVDDNGTEGKYETRFDLDILGNQIQVTDALGRLITINRFNMAKEPIRTQSMDAGRRWSLTNSMGNPLYQWNDRHFKTRFEYDELQRNTGVFVAENGSAEAMVYKTIYGEQHSAPKSLNLFGQLWEMYDQSGRVNTEGYDFKGNPLKIAKQVAEDYKNRLDWAAATPPALENEVFTTSSEYDALNRPIKTIAPDGSTTIYTYNEANFLEKIDTILRGGTTATAFVENIDYDAKGQRTRIRYGNGVNTRYDYDPKTFRLTRLLSTRNSGSDILQDLNYYYDPVGNITDQRDNAQQTIFYANSRVEPHGAYTYDALYRLIQAEGREQIGQSNNPTDPKHDFIVDIAINPNDGQAMRRYIETYQYDALGNILEVKHQAGGGTAFQNNWTRSYFYNDSHLFQTGKVSNRLTKTTILGSNAVYTYDVHGNMTQMPHLPTMHWDFADQLQQVSLPNAEAEYYTYAAPNEKGFGERSRKVTEKTGGKRYDRIYLGGFEIYREYTANGIIDLERETLHIMDDKSRIALIDTQTIKNQSPIANPQPLIRFQLSNHLGSATIELNEKGLLISYEEYYPFGGSSYQAANGSMEASRKRYRYVGKELDEATGLYYYGARYYAAWLCRWCSCDPAGFIDGFNLYSYVNNNPIRLTDNYGFSGDENKHTIQKGDTYWNLAQHSNGKFTVSDLKKWNSSVDWTNLQIGSEINLSNPNNNKKVDSTNITISGININPDSHIKYLPIENPSDYNISWSVDIKYEGKIGARFQVGYEKSSFLVYGYAYAGLEFSGMGEYSLTDGKGDASMSFNFIYGYAAGYNFSDYYSQETSYSGVVPIYEIGKSQKKQEFELQKYKVQKEKPIEDKPPYATDFSPSKLDVKTKAEIFTTATYDKLRGETTWKTTVSAAVSAKLSIPVPIPAVNLIKPQVILEGSGKVSLIFYVKFSKKTPTVPYYHFKN